jgi:DUF4097 and DUF4098 domain-containing protein YvlB
VSKQLPLTPGRLTALLIGVPVSLAAIGWGALSVVALASLDSFAIHRSFPPSGSQLSVTVDSGALTLEPSIDDQVHLDGTARYGLVRPTIDVSSTGGGVSVTISCPWFVASECSADLTVAVPSGIALTASTASGNITASNLDNLSLQATSGNVQITGGAGLVHLSAVSGQITGVAMDAADVHASATSGDVSLDFAQPPSDVTVQDTSGNVTVTLPPGGPAYAVSAHSVSGNTSIDVPTDPTSRHDISVSVVSGNVVVDPAG